MKTIGPVEFSDSCRKLARDMEQAKEIAASPERMELMRLSILAVFNSKLDVGWRLAGEVRLGNPEVHELPEEDQRAYRAGGYGEFTACVVITGSAMLQEAFK